MASGNGEFINVVFAVVFTFNVKSFSCSESSAFLFLFVHIVYHIIKAYTIMPDARNLTSTAQVLLPLLPPLLFSIVTFILALRRNRKSGDVYAVS